MLLSDLKWEPAYVSPDLEFARVGKNMRVWRGGGLLQRPGNYSIRVYIVTNDGSHVEAVKAWDDLDPLAAQAVLFHLCSEDGDAAERT